MKNLFCNILIYVVGFITACLILVSFIVALILAIDLIKSNPFKGYNFISTLLKLGAIVIVDYLLLVLMAALCRLFGRLMDR